MAAEGTVVVVAATACSGPAAETFDLGCHCFGRASSPVEFPGHHLVCYCHIIANCLDCVDFGVDFETDFAGLCLGCGHLCLILYRRLCFHLYLCCYVCFPWDLRPSSRLGNPDSITLIAFLVLGTMVCFGS